MDAPAWSWSSGPFRFREAAEFWDAGHDHELAFRLNALVGGDTPAYKDMSGSGPREKEALDRWVERRLLSPASAMFREGTLLLREEPSIADPTSYLCVGTRRHQRRGQPSVGDRGRSRPPVQRAGAPRQPDWRTSG